MNAIPIGPVKVFSLSILMKEDITSKDERMCLPEEVQIITMLKLVGSTGEILFIDLPGSTL